MQFCAYLRKKLTRAKASARNHRSQPLARFLHLPQINLASSVIAALRTFETGQFFSASLAIGIPNPDALGGPNHEFDPRGTLSPFPHHPSSTKDYELCAKLAI
jgi:hypothetical protein